MNTSQVLPFALCLAGALAWPLAHAAPLDKAEYRASKSRIAETYKTDKAACSSLTANDKDVCVQEAKGKDKVARAELEFAYSGTPKDENKVQVAKAEAMYAVAKEKCDSLSGNSKDVCVKEAKSTEVKSLAEAKMGRKVEAAISTAATETVDAKYKLAAEKCEAMTGDAKTSCMATAKANAGKN